MNNSIFNFDKRFQTARDLIDFFINDPRFQTNSKFDAVRTGRAGMIFRGHADSEWKLEPTAFRVVNNKLPNFCLNPPDEIITGKLEALGNHLIAEYQAVKYFLVNADNLGLKTPIDYATPIPELENAIKALNGSDEFDPDLPFPIKAFERATALAQHHGVPTRLLDWSESPFIACYFAAYNISVLTEEKKTAQSDRSEDDLAIFFAPTYQFQDEDSKVQLVKATRSENSHLLQQQGVFTNIVNANRYFLDHGRWPTLEDMAVNGFAIGRVRLPVSEANDLLRLLFDMNITRHSLMPSLTHAATAFEYAKILFSKK